MSTRWPDKRLVDGGELQLLWTDAAPAGAERDDPSIVLPDEPADLLGAACAWLCVLISALTLAVALLRWAWVVIFG